MTRARLIVASALVAAAGCAEPPSSPLAARSVASNGAIQAGGTYVLIANGNSLPDGLAAQVADAGGTLTSEMPGIGVAVAESSDPSFADRAGMIAGMKAVVADEIHQFQDPDARVVEVSEMQATLDEASHAVGGHETFRNAQWAPDAIQAPAAWAAGAQGAGARVAILDGGLYNAHPDIGGGLDVARSVSFVPGRAYNTDTGTGWHGTHVAGIVGARANNFLTVGIAPQSTIIGVKVLHSGSGAFSWIMNGIYYAATPIAEGGAGAHIINMSLGAQIDGRGAGIAHLLNALSRATSYARQRGVLVVAAAGNDAVDLDHTGNTVFVPAQSVGVTNVASTGPVGFALGATNFDRPSSFTNFGQSAITLAGPGGDFALPGNQLCAIPRIPASSGNLVNSCWVFDMVMSSCRGSSNPPFFSACWMAGTSMAAPAVSGVAALIVGKFGPMHPAQLEARLRDSADDLGKPGNDDFYGRGRVNALRAVQ